MPSVSAAPPPPASANATPPCATVRVQAGDLPLRCPPPGQAGWNAHPRVYLPIEQNQGRARCPYCSTEYVLEGPVRHRH